MPGLRFGLALHIGDVLYGNIGSGNRLDFTCIGPAVNFAARIEKLAGDLGRGVLASGEFAKHCRGEFTALGEFTLPGVSVVQKILASQTRSRSSDRGAVSQRRSRAWRTAPARSR